jgi:hypothetical protein
MDQLYKRAASLIWRSAMMGVAVALAYAAENIGALELAPGHIAILGLVLGEVSKAIRNYLV